MFEGWRVEGHLAVDDDVEIAREHRVRLVRELDVVVAEREIEREDVVEDGIRFGIRDLAVLIEISSATRLC